MAEEVEKPVEETIEKVEKVTPEPPKPVEDTTTHPSDEIPHWGKELKDGLEKLSETVNGLAAQGASGTPVAEVIEETDDTPQKKPWTHRNPFGK